MPKRRRFAPSPVRGARACAGDASASNIDAAILATALLAAALAGCVEEAPIAVAQSMRGLGAWEGPLPNGAFPTGDNLNGALAYHPASDETVAVAALFSHFTWDRERWTRGTLDGFSGTEASALALDRRGKLVHFGGTVTEPFGNTEYPDETHTYDGVGWTRERTSSSPPSRLFFSMVFTSTGTVMLGGAPPTPDRSNFFWKWDGDEWFELSTEGMPPPRSEAMVAYDASDDAIVVFGGRDPLTSEPFDDTWIYQNSSWTMLPEDDPHPPGRFAGAVAYQPLADRMIIFGGKEPEKNGVHYFHDLWSFDAGRRRWTEFVSSNTPQRDVEMKMTWDAGELVLLARAPGTEDDRGETWKLTITGTDAASLEIISAPSEGEVGMELAAPFVVRVLDDRGLVIPNYPVRFESADAMSPAATVTGNTLGEAAYTGRCGERAEPQRWTINAGAAAAELTVVCVPGPTAELVLELDGEVDSGVPVQGTLSTRDRYQNPTTNFPGRISYAAEDANTGAAVNGDVLPDSGQLLPNTSSTRVSFIFVEPGVRIVRAVSDAPALSASVMVTVVPPAEPNIPPAIAIRKIEPKAPEGELAAGGVFSVDEGAQIQIEFTIRDDAPNLRVDSEIPAGAVLEGAGNGNTVQRTLFWKPERGDAGTYRIALTAVDAGRAEASVELTVHVRGSYYGCSDAGRTGGELAWLLPALALLWLRKNKLWVVLVFLSASSTAAAQDDFLDGRARVELEPSENFVRRSVAFLGLSATSSISPEVVNSLAEYVITQLVDADVYQVIAKSDVQAIVSYEGEKQLLGADTDPNFLAKLGNKLGAARVVRGDISRVGSELVLNLSLLDVGEVKVLARSARRAPGGAGPEVLLDIVRPAIIDLIARDPDPGVQQRAASLRSGGWDRSTQFYVNLALRSDADVYGGGIGFGAEVAAGGEYFGGALAVLVARPSDPRPIGLRLEGRVHPLRFGVLVPYFGVGATAFLPEIGLRGAIGANLSWGSFLIEADFAFEHYPSPAEVRRDTAMLLSLGLGIAI